MSEELYSRLRGATVEQVLKVSVNEGDGVEGDPIVQVTYWYTIDGRLIGSNDTKTRQFVPNTSADHHG